MKYQLSIAARLEYLSPDAAMKLDEQAEELVRVSRRPHPIAAG